MVTVSELAVTQFTVEVAPVSEIITVNIGIGSAAGGAYTSTSFQADFQGNDTSDLSEGTNLYFTAERVADTMAGVLTGGDNTTITYSDLTDTITIDVNSPPELQTQLAGTAVGENVSILNFSGPGVTITDSSGVTTVTVSGTPVGDTDDLPEGTTNQYFTNSRSTQNITAQVDKAFVDNLNINAVTLSGLASSDFATSAQGTLADTAVQSADIGQSIQAYSAVLDGTTASYTTQTDSKLSGIEPGATADQTDSEIKTAYEANTNTNAYTDSEVTKLAGIETSATADQNAGEIKTLYESNTNTNAFTDAEKTKLSNTQTSSDQTNSTTVNAAGAVMNSDTTTADMQFVIDEDTMLSDSAVKVPTQQSVKNYVDNAVVGNLTYRGAYNASANIPDLDTSPGGISTGDLYTVTQAGMFFSTQVEPGDAIIANQNSPVSESDWTIVQGNLTPATIKTNYESNADTNAFTDSEKTKLSGTESGATSDQTPAELLAAMLTVDGTGSGLDAAVLSGETPGYYLDYTNTTNKPDLYTSTNFDTDLSTKTTTDVSEGANLYFTTNRVSTKVKSQLVAGNFITLVVDEGLDTITITGESGYDQSDFDIDFDNKSTSDLTEGTNQYFTTNRVNTAINTTVTAGFVNALDLTFDGGTF
jgi:hypothetical protein